MKELASQDLPYERQMWPRDEALQFFATHGEPLKVQLIEEKTAGQAEVSCYTIKDRPDTFVDFCVGPHVPSTGKLKAFKLLTTSNAYWKGDAQEPADAARLRHGVPQRIGAEGAPAADRGSQEARPPQGRQGHSASSCSTRGRRARRSGSRKGTMLYNTLAELHARRVVPGRLRRSEGADRLQQGVVGDVRALAALSPEHVPGRERRRADGPQGDELPGPLPDLRQRGAQLSRSADPLPRADAAPPQRSVGRAVRPDARPPVQPGRRALLRDGVADRRRSRAAAAAGAARLRRLRAQAVR